MILSYSEYAHTTRMAKLVFKAYKKTDKIFFYNFSIYKNVNRILSKKQRNAFKKGF